MVFSSILTKKIRKVMLQSFSQEELSLVDIAKMPKHVAIIMDGNRRWAAQKGISKLSGHKKGADNLIRIVSAASDLNIKILTVYAFSTENWDRSKKEVDILWRLFEEYLARYEKEFVKKEIRLQIIGDISKCPPFLQKRMKRVLEKTAGCKKIILVLAINYGGRDEILRSFKKMLGDYDQKKFNKDDLSEEMIASYLDTAKLSDPELLIRTSGELRLSNFLLWQLSYSEFYIAQTFWPDFSPKELLTALVGFQNRKRRFGGL